MNVQNYPWSSDRFYREPETNFVETGLLLDIVSGGVKQSVQKYSRFMEHDDEHPITENFTVPKNKKPEGRNEDVKKSGDRKSLDKILTETVVKQEELELIKRGSRMRKLTAVKEIYAKKAYNELKDIQ